MAFSWLVIGFVAGLVCFFCILSSGSSFNGGVSEVHSASQDSWAW